MKIRYTLLSAVALPLAAYRIWQLLTIVNWETGFSSSDVVQQLIEIALFLCPLLLIPVLDGLCRRHGLSAAEFGYSPMTRVFFLASAAALGYYLFLRIADGLPARPAHKVLFIITCLLQMMAVLRYLLNALLGKDLPPLSNSLTGLFPALFFAMELLQRFFGSISNPYDTTSDISFFSCILLSLAALRLLQYGTSISERRQRTFLWTSLMCFIICMAWRLPTIIIYLSCHDLTLMLQLCADTACAITYYLCAMDVMGEEY